jgi:hypothetical protein
MPWLARNPRYWVLNLGTKIVHVCRIWSYGHTQSNSSWWNWVKNSLKANQQLTCSIIHKPYHLCPWKIFSHGNLVSSITLTILTISGTLGPSIINKLFPTSQGQCRIGKKRIPFAVNFGVPVLSYTITFQLWKQASSDAFQAIQQLQSYSISVTCGFQISDLEEWAKEENYSWTWCSLLTKHNIETMRIPSDTYHVDQDESNSG